VSEIECRQCEGEGRIDRTVGSLWGRVVKSIHEDCPFCNGTGWREPTQDESDELAEAAYDRSLEGEPPMSMQERHERDWKKKQDLRR
jgi:hypothetical protein